jgi:hypothetical protein
MIPGQGLNDESHIVVNVRNVGDQATTITHFAGAYYPTLMDRFRRRNARHFVITTGADVPIPHKIGPGETWSGYAVQTELEKVGGQAGRLYMGVQHSMAEKPQFTRVRFKKPAP